MCFPSLENGLLQASDVLAVNSLKRFQILHVASHCCFITVAVLRTTEGFSQIQHKSKDQRYNPQSDHAVKPEKQ